jgi:hypothetical protein
MLLLRKGHLDQLENSEYLSLTDAERGQLKDIRLLANRTHNKIPNDPQQVRFLTRSRGQNGFRTWASFGSLGSLKSGVLTLRPLQMSTFRLQGACTMSAKSAL